MENKSELEEKIRDFLAYVRSGKSLYALQKRSEIKELMTDAFIYEIASHPAIWIYPHKLFEKLPTDLGFYFCSRVFAMHEKVPSTVLLKLWCCVILRHDSKHEPFHWDRYINCTEEFLIDLRFARKHICREKKNGFRFFRHMDGGRRGAMLQFPPTLREAMKEDSIERFMMILNMSGTKLTYSLIADLAEESSLKILSFLFKNRLIPETVMTMEEFCIMTLASYYGQKCKDLLLMIDNTKENFLRDFRDPFNRNLLWYTVELGDKAFFHPQNEIIPFLLSRNCDPENRNQVGLSWKFVMGNIPFEWKLKWMKQSGFCAGSMKEFLADHNEEKKKALKLVSSWDGMLVPNVKLSRLRVKKNTRKSKRLLPELSNLLANNDLLPLSWQKNSGIISAIPQKNTRDVRNTEDRTKAVDILKTGILLYHPQVVEYYCRNAFPGYKILRHFGGHYHSRFPDQELSALISADDVSEIALRCGEDHINCTFGLFDEAIRHHSEKICEWFLDEAPELSSDWNMEELLFHVVSSLEDDDAIHAVNLINKREDNITERCFDCFGSNLLWYALFNPSIKSIELGDKRDKKFAVCRSFEQFWRFSNPVSPRGLAKYLQILHCRSSAENSFTLTARDASEILKIRKTVQKRNVQ